MPVATTALFLCFASAAVLASEPTPKDAVAMVERAAAVMKEKGKDELFKRLMAKSPEFLQGSLYVYARDLKTGIMLAHPANPTLVGKDLTDVPDTNGKIFRREILDLAARQGKGWVDYTYRNPANGKVEPKTTYILRVDDIVLHAGVYKPAN
jgi:cytochrome c